MVFGCAAIAGSAHFIALRRADSGIRRAVFLNRGKGT